MSHLSATRPDTETSAGQPRLPRPTPPDGLHSSLPARQPGGSASPPGRAERTFLQTALSRPVCVSVWVCMCVCVCVTVQLAVSPLSVCESELSSNYRHRQRTRRAHCFCVGPVPGGHCACSRRQGCAFLYHRHRPPAAARHRRRRAHGSVNKNHGPRQKTGPGGGGVAATGFGCRSAVDSSHRQRQSRRCVLVASAGRAGLQTAQRLAGRADEARLMERESWRGCCSSTPMVPAVRSFGCLILRCHPSSKKLTYSRWSNWSEPFPENMVVIKCDREREVSLIKANAASPHDPWWT